MISMVRPVRQPVAPRAWARTIIRRGPEHWLFVVAGAGWLLLITHAIVGSKVHGAAAGHTSVMAGHAMHGHVMPDMPGMATEGARGSRGWATAATWGMGPMMWAGMLAATMLPLIAPNVRYAALRSPRRRRRRV